MRVSNNQSNHAAIGADAQWQKEFRQALDHTQSGMAITPRSGADSNGGANTVTHGQEPTHVSIIGIGLGADEVQQWRDGVQQVLDKIGKSETGKALFLELGGAQHRMVITPWKGNAAHPNADADTVVHDKEATKRGMPLRRNDNGKIVLIDGKRVLGLGTGADSYVKFTPAVFAEYCAKNKDPQKKSGAQPDEVLFHEMVHAVRDMLGLSNPEPLGNSYGTKEEFFAILLANIYASETRRPEDISANHEDYSMAIDNTDAKFLPSADPADYRYRLVQQFVLEHPNLANDLRRIPAERIPFNPVRRYFELQKLSQ
jgi:hypothetical protein